MAASFMTHLTSSLIQTAAFSLINAIIGKGKECGFLPFLALLLMMKVQGKGVRRAGRGYKSINKNF